MSGQCNQASCSDVCEKLFCRSQGTVGGAAAKGTEAPQEARARIPAAVLWIPCLLLLTLAVHAASPELGWTLGGLTAALAGVAVAWRRRRGVAAERSIAGMYELTDLLGAGGMGEVWKGRHRLLARPAAVKLIRTQDQNPSVKARFEREAQVTASLQSVHTVELYDYGVTRAGVAYYVMELLDGVDLRELVLRDGPLPAPRVAYLTQQILDSLAEAHASGLVHRDIKPANIYVTQRGLRRDFAKVLDFGLVTLAGNPIDAACVRLTDNGSMVGTPAYMAPERWLDDSASDHRVDIYALGCVAYWLLTGREVFEAKTRFHMALLHATQTPTRPSQRTDVDVDVPESLERLIMACLAKDPDQRPASAIDLLHDLERTGIAQQWRPDETKTQGVSEHRWAA
jgi:eukaryotic-like serine/threonine-protein kinase